MRLERMRSSPKRLDRCAASPLGLFSVPRFVYAREVPAPIAPLIGFALGTLFAWTARRELARARAYGHGSPMLVLCACYALLVFAPLSGYFLAFVPDWSFAYLVDPRRLPRGFEVACALVNATSIPLGFAVA